MVGGVRLEGDPCGRSAHKSISRLSSSHKSLAHLNTSCYFVVERKNGSHRFQFKATRNDVRLFQCHIMRDWGCLAWYHPQKSYHKRMWHGCCNVSRRSGIAKPKLARSSLLPCEPYTTPLALEHTHGMYAWRVYASWATIQGVRVQIATPSVPHHR